TRRYICLSFLSGYARHRDLLSFPTRRSSDLSERRSQQAALSSPSGSASGWPELHRQPVHAVTQPGRSGAVVEDVAEMAAAVGTMDFTAGVSELVVGLAADRAGQRPVEAWPAGTAVELRVAREQFVAAPGAQECALALFLVERRAERPLGIFLA